MCVMELVRKPVVIDWFAQCPVLYDEEVKIFNNMKNLRVL